VNHKMERGGCGAKGDAILVGFQAHVHGRIGTLDLTTMYSGSLASSSSSASTRMRNVSAAKNVTRTVGESGRDSVKERSSLRTTDNCLLCSAVCVPGRNVRMEKPHQCHDGSEDADDHRGAIPIDPKHAPWNNFSSRTKPLAVDNEPSNYMSCIAE